MFSVPRKYRLASWRGVFVSKTLSPIAMEVSMTSRKVHNRTLTVLLACVATVLWSFPAQAQLAGATLSGVVKDTSGAVVVDGTVSIKNPATGTVRQVTTNADGF